MTLNFLRLCQQTFLYFFGFLCSSSLTKQSCTHTDTDRHRRTQTDCVWSRIGQMARHSTPRRSGTRCLLVPVSGVDDASENRLVKRRCEETNETVNPRERRHRDETTFVRTHRIVQPLSQTSVTHELCTRKMCACGRTARCSLYTLRRVHGRHKI